MAEQEGQRGSHVVFGVDRTGRIRRGAMRVLLGSSGLSLGLTFLSFAVSSPTPFFLAFIPGMAAFAALGGLGFATSRRPLPMAPGSVEITGDAIVVRHPWGKVARAVPLAELSQGHWEDPDRLHLVERSGVELVLRPRGPGEGEALLRAARLTARDRVLRAPLAAWASTFPGAWGLTLCAFLLTSPMAAFSVLVVAIGLRDVLQHPGQSANLIALAILGTGAAMLIALSVALFRGLVRREAVVGTDGVRFRKTMRSELIPYADVTGVARHPRGVRIDRRKDPPVVLPTMRASYQSLSVMEPEGRERTADEAARDALIDRIHAAMAARAEGSSGLETRALIDQLDRNERPLAEWKADLAGVLRRQGDGYRGARIEVSDLAALIEDAAAPVERRVAAAVALSSSQPEEARRRVRIAVEAAADADLQAALERAAEGEIAEEPLGRAALRARPREG